MAEHIIYNLNIYSGADYKLDLTLTEDDGTVIDLANMTAEAQLREYPEAKDHIDFTVTKASNVFTVSMPKEETGKIPYTQGYYDVFVYNTSTEIRSCLISGKVSIISQVTRGDEE